jgi:protein-S-isoprenylcysteine O-methyltransferase Ste14
MLAVFSPWLDGYRMNLPVWVRAAGAIVFASSGLLFFWVHKWLGKNWSPILEIKEEHKLVIGGPYKFVRHPMYTQIWLWVICQGLVLSNWVVEILGILAWAILYFIRVPREEQMMTAEFGTQYEEYKKRTGRVLPGGFFIDNSNK